MIYQPCSDNLIVVLILLLKLLLNDWLERPARLTQGRRVYNYAIVLVSRCVTKFTTVEPHLDVIYKNWYNCDYAIVLNTLEINKLIVNKNVKDAKASRKYYGSWFAIANQSLCQCYCKWMAIFYRGSWWVDNCTDRKSKAMFELITVSWQQFQ